MADIVGDKAERLVGKNVLDEGGKAIVEILRELGVLKKVERYKHKYPYDWKTGKPIIMMCVPAALPTIPAELSMQSLSGLHPNGSLT